MVFMRVSDTEEFLRVEPKLGSFLDKAAVHVVCTFVSVDFFCIFVYL